jgi:hypothetical protein
MDIVTTSMMIDSMFIASPLANPIAKSYVSDGKQKKTRRDCHENKVSHRFPFGVISFSRRIRVNGKRGFKQAEETVTLRTSQEWPG